MLPIGQEEPIQRGMRTGDERDGFARRAVVEVVPGVLLRVWVLLDEHVRQDEKCDDDEAITDSRFL